jgi:hypothetical protein
MPKSLIILAILIGLMLSVAACAQGTQRSISTPVLRDSPDLPAPLAVISATRLEGQLGMGPPQNFGHAIALGEHVLAVGAPEHLGMSGNEPGRVYVFQHEGYGWIEAAQLFSSDRDDGFQYDQHFGMAVAMDGDLLFVGAPDADDPQLGDNSGAVYVFQNGPDGWMEIERLAAEQPFANVGFGSQLEVSGDTLVVGEGYQGTHLYIFHNQGEGWRQQASLEIPQIDDLETSVGAMALYGDTLAVSLAARQGEREHSSLFSQVVIYQRRAGQWEQADVLPIGEAGWGDYSYALALDGSQGQASRLAVGTARSQSGFLAGAVYIYDRGPSGWERSVTLTAPDGQSWDMFGSSLALDGDMLLVGAGMASEDSFWDGVAYSFQYHQGSWVDQLRLTPPEDGGSPDIFGEHVAVQGDTYLISAPGEFGNAVYVYEIGERP